MAFCDADVLSGRMEMQHATAARTIKVDRVRRHLRGDVAARSLRVKHRGVGGSDGDPRRAPSRRSGTSSGD